MGVIDVGEFIPGEPEHLVTHGLRGPPWRRPPLVAVPQALDALRAKLPEHAEYRPDRPAERSGAHLDRQSTSLNPPENLDALHLFHGQHQLLVWFHGPRRY